MSWIARNIEWVLIVSGLATCSMLVMTAAPRFSMQTISVRPRTDPSPL